MIVSLSNYYDHVVDVVAEGRMKQESLFGQNSKIEQDEDRDELLKG